MATPSSPSDRISPVKIIPPTVLTSGYPSPPPSTTSSSSWSHRPFPMDLHASTSGLEGSWRMEGDLSRRSKDIWDIRGSHHEGLGLDINDTITSLGRNVGGSAESAREVSMEKEKGKGKEKEMGKGKEVLGVEVWAKVMDTSRGRDKVLKCAQYSLRTYLYLLTLVSRLRPLSPWFRSNHKRVKMAISGLSLTRKCLLLLNPLHPLTDLLSPHPMSARTLLSHLIDLISAISDDAYCLSRLGLVGRKTGGIADRWSNRFWLLTTIMGLYKLHLKTIPRLRSSATFTPPSAAEKRRSDLSEAEWTNRKLLADLLFVSYDVFELNWPVLEEPMKCLTGLTAGLISTVKLYNAQWDASVGKG
ncbi:hypothetical protein IAR55_000066 [Kwoniella newhampshirensis]|uniref:Peroxisomal membrane protein PEX11 n=1 Tax=Kwoniella newhampshirensis TaxID=1651941 RepID=A0AAW0Z5U0_9TREE